jgi:type II secretory ATPase GspE/PulE/Tfp pilus assembly ATPase PilB-like protein
MAQLNITERRLPQDGRIKIRMNDLELDLRVSVIPTIFGEAVQIRLLSSGFFLQLDKLGMNPTDMAMVGSAIEKTHGIIFVSGPTGSGKSTTLYACLSKINSDRIKIITIEDPVEYQLRGVNQIQVVPQIGYSFASALRHMLRHDPDVMMIGEVRDYETAEIAIRSALTGHLVFSTLHTNDAAGVVTRLLDMGVEPYLVSSSLECLVAQRLVRIICPHCRQEVSREQRAKLKPLMKDLECDFETAVFYEGKGCEACRFTGYIGRTGIYEVLPVTQSVRDMIIERRSSQQIKQLAVSQGMKTLRQDGLRKIASGITTLEEVMRVTQEIYSE